MANKIKNLRGTQFEDRKNCIDVINILCDEGDEIRNDVSRISGFYGLSYHATTGATAEQISTLQLTAGSPENYRIIYSLPLPSLAVGDIIIATAQFEVTSELGYAVGLGRYLALNTSATNPLTATQYVTRPVMDNFTSGDEHHFVVNLHRQYKSVVATSGNYLTLTIWAVSTNYQSGDNLTVEQNYGHLDITIYKPMV